MPIYAVPVRFHVTGVIYVETENPETALCAVTGGGHRYGMSEASVLLAIRRETPDVPAITVGTPRQCSGSSTPYPDTTVNPCPKCHPGG